MPVYRWKGVGRQGALCSGTDFAPTLIDLRALLVKQDVGLVNARIVLFQRRISRDDVDTFFIHFSSLLSASITVSKALELCASQCKNLTLQKALRYSYDVVLQGMPLNNALGVCAIADELCLSLIIAGEKSGDLAKSLQLYVEHRAFVKHFFKKLRASLIGPLLTFIFFIIIMGTIFIGVIPLFEHYFASYSEPLPVATQFILSVSWHLRSASFVMGLASAFFAMSCAVILLRTKIPRSLLERAYFSIPVLGYLLKQNYRVRFFSLVSILLRQNITVVNAIETCHASFKNSLVQKELKALIEKISRGEPFSKAMQSSLVATEEMVALIAIGEATGHLAKMVEFGAVKERELFYETITRYGNLLQPLIIVLLGILITGLIFAVYMPIVTLSSFIA